MKRFQKKRNNKGFSLVELIVVIAIMAVLAGVLTPTLIKKVESGRLAKDKSALDNLRECMVTALADEKYMDITKTVTITVAENTAIDVSAATGQLKAFSEDYATEVEDLLGKKSLKLTSKLKKADTKIILTINNGDVRIDVDGVAVTGNKYDFSIPEDSELSTIPEPVEDGK